VQTEADSQLNGQSETFAQFVNRVDTIVFPGAMGTELQRRGYRSTLPLWSAGANLEAADLVAQIHSDYFAAGADVAITNTFRTTPRAFRKLGREGEARAALEKSMAIALRATRDAGRAAFVGGSFAPLEDCYSPASVPSESELRQEHRLHATWLAEAGADFLLPETINSGIEAQIMAEAASVTGLPFIISFVVDACGRLLDGTPIAEAVEKTDLPGRVGVSLNCRPVDIIDEAFLTLSSVYDGAIGLYPNGIGCPHDDLGWCFTETDDDVEKFVSSALRWKRQGVKIIGGCCGTTPDYIRELRKALLKAKGKPACHSYHSGQQRHGANRPLSLPR
jgi:homocysteine S-methyltransferase